MLALGAADIGAQAVTGVGGIYIREVVRLEHSTEREGARPVAKSVDAVRVVVKYPGICGFTCGEAVDLRAAKLV